MLVKRFVEFVVARYVFFAIEILNTVLMNVKNKESLLSVFVLGRLITYKMREYPGALSHISANKKLCVY